MYLVNGGDVLKKFLLCIFLFFIVIPLSAAGVKAVLKINHKKYGVGQFFKVSVIINSTKKISGNIKVIFNSTNDLVIKYNGRSSNYSATYLNGKFKSTYQVSFMYDVKVVKTGRIICGPIPVVIDNKKYFTNKVELQISKKAHYYRRNNRDTFFNDSSRRKPLYNIILIGKKKLAFVKVPLTVSVQLFGVSSVKKLMIYYDRSIFKVSVLSQKEKRLKKKIQTSFTYRIIPLRKGKFWFPVFYYNYRDAGVGFWRRARTPSIKIKVVRSL